VRGQSTIELAFLMPVLMGLVGLTLQGGAVLSDQIALQHYAEEGGLWAQNNQETATTTDIQGHIYGQMCGGASGPPSSSGSKYCRGSTLQVAVSTVSTPTSQVRPHPTAGVLAATSCKTWNVTVTPGSATTSQGSTVSYTVTLVIGNGQGNLQSPSVALSVSGYPNGTSPGFPTFNPPSVTSASPVSTLSFATTSGTTPKSWTVDFGGLDQCGAGSATGLVTSALTVTGSASPSPCSSVTVLQPSPASVTSGAGGTLTIPGTGFQAGAAVTFGATASASVTYVSATQLTATVPASLALGVYNVTVSVSGGCSGSRLNGLAVVAASPSPSPTPVVAGFNPCAGTAGNYETSIVITWNETLLIPWFTQAMQMRATQFTFCQ